MGGAAFFVPQRTGVSRVNSRIPGHTIPIAMRMILNRRARRFSAFGLRMGVCVMTKRLVGLFTCLVFLYTMVSLRVLVLTGGEESAQAARNQSTYTLEIANRRGTIYDCNFNPLVNDTDAYMLAVSPNDVNVNSLLSQIPFGSRSAVLRNSAGHAPFLVSSKTPFVNEPGVEVVKYQKRYDDRQLAPHLIGYLDGSGTQGKSGLELAYDEMFSENASQTLIRYEVDGKGRPLKNSSPQIVTTGSESQKGIVLTIDRRIQNGVQTIAEDMIDRGAVVVMEAHTGKIRACVSMPSFDPYNVAASLDDPGSPLVNRALKAYSVGSSFKLMVAAAALESGVSPNLTYTCTGAIDVGGQVFHCNDHEGHGTLDLRGAIEQSCNPYFINLAAQFDPQKIIDIAAGVGFGKSDELAKGISTSAGKLPSMEDLPSQADVSNFAFGQGVLMANPIQVAKMVATIVNGGEVVQPMLLEGISDDTGTQFAEKTEPLAKLRVFSEKTAQRLQQDMRAVVEEGSGKRARPAYGIAGGKTASAQTGQYNADGKEIVHAWFTGFCSNTETPKYVVIVFNEGGESGALTSGPIFKRIATFLYDFEEARSDR